MISGKEFFNYIVAAQGLFFFSLHAYMYGAQEWMDTTRYCFEISYYHNVKVNFRIY